MRRNKFPEINNLDTELDLIVLSLTELTGKKIAQFPPLNQTPEMARFIKKLSSTQYEEYIKIDGAFRLLGGGGSGGSAYIELQVSGGYIQWRDDPAGTWTNLIATADLKGDKGDQGDTGPQGDAGPGVAIGGTTGQVLKKKSNTNYDTEWKDETGGGGEANTASNVGTGEGTIFKEKSGVDLRFKSVKQGNGITISNNADDITITGKTQSNVGNGAEIIKEQVDNDYKLRSIEAGNAYVQVDYSSDGNKIRISANPALITAALITILGINSIGMAAITYTPAVIIVAS